ncbi:high affinity copper uptake protein 1-like [Colias croceus]|uniref:high affinity copper uptake protein 1-like n=1 Tax=Colias crocea TaxID=72248 RepID=UPI001E279E55|nr:high affinity copper uptake protein 1-like [Colias croceus]XP_045508558.1 high affinity copper uptake protein 1-like [Colias croceus]
MDPHHMHHLNHGMDHGGHVPEGMENIEHAAVQMNGTHFMEDINVNKIFNTSDNFNMMNGDQEAMTHEHHGQHAHHDMGHSMTFHGGYLETILFSWWKVTDAGEFVGSFLAIFLVALLYEGLKYYRKHLLWKTYTGLQYCAVSPPDKGVSNICAPDDPQVIQPVPHVLDRNTPTMMSTAHAWQTVLHGVQVLVSYMLMLVFMTYNTWLCAAVVLGSATGYFFFGWRESVVVDFTEHCH